MVKIEYEITAESKKLYTQPIVEKIVADEIVHYTVQASPAEVARILRSIDAKAVFHGRQVVDKSGNRTTPAELLQLAGVQQTVPEIKCQWNYSQWAVAAQREFAKIALGTGHFILGEPFSRSAEASRLREFLTGPEGALDSIPIPGIVWPGTVGSPLEKLARVLGDATCHLVALLRFDDQLNMFISLFGHMNGKLLLSQDASICKLVEPNNGVIIQVDPQTQQFKRRMFSELLQALSSAADHESGLS